MQASKRLFSKHMLLFFSFFFVSSTWSISQGAAWAGAGATGLLTGTPALFCPGEWKLMSIPLFGVGFFIGRCIFYQFTPDCRMANAEYQLNTIASHRLAHTPYITERQLFGIIEDEYVTRTWPLISAFNDLTSYINLSQHAKNLANKAQWEDHGFVPRARALNAQADMFIDNMKGALKSIRASEDYFTELDLFKKEQRHNEQIRVQQSIAQAQWANAKAQQEIAEAQKKIAEIKKRELDSEERKKEESSLEHRTIGCVNVIVNGDGK